MRSELSELNLRSRQSKWGSPIGTCILIAALASSCQTKFGGRVEPSKTPSDNVNFAGDCPVWIFIPSSTISSQGRGFPAEIALPPRKYDTNRMEVEVAGSILAPGKITIPVGATLLQAIGYAGGFTTGAFTRFLHVSNDSGMIATLYLRSQAVTGAWYRRAWYASDTRDPARSPKVESSAPPPHDFILHSGDKVYVARASL